MDVKSLRKVFVLGERDVVKGVNQEKSRDQIGETDENVNQFPFPVFYSLYRLAKGNHRMVTK